MKALSILKAKLKFQNIYKNVSSMKPRIAETKEAIAEIKALQSKIEDFKEQLKQVHTAKDYVAKVYYESEEDNYEQGLLLNGCSNYWDETVNISANTAKEALAKAIESTSYNINIDDGACDGHVFMVSTLVDKNNSEATKEEVELWKKDKFRLWNLDISISLYQMTEVDIEGHNDKWRNK